MLTDDLSCAKDVEGAKLAFFKQFKSIYHKFSFVDKNVLLHIFRLHVMSFYGAETWYTKINKNTLKIFHYLIIKLSNVSVEEILTIVIIKIELAITLKHLI